MLQAKNITFPLLILLARVGSQALYRQMRRINQPHLKLRVHMYDEVHSVFLLLLEFLANTGEHSEGTTNGVAKQ